MSFNEEQSASLRQQLDKILHQIIQLTEFANDELDCRSAESVGAHVSRMRGAVATISLDLFRIYGKMHEFSQANWPKASTLPSRPTVDDL